MAAMPASVIGHEEDAKLVSQCLDFCQTLAGKSLTFSFSLTIGTNFTFSVDTMGNGTLASKEKKKKPTPSAMRRNARRREEFLNKKRNASTAAKPFQSKPAAVKEAEAPAKAPSGLLHHPSPSPSSERRQVRERGQSPLSVNWMVIHLPLLTQTLGVHHCHKWPASRVAMDGARRTTIVRSVKDATSSVQTTRDAIAKGASVSSAIQEQPMKINEQSNVTIFFLQSFSVVLFNTLCAVLG